MSSNLIVIADRATSLTNPIANTVFTSAIISSLPSIVRLPLQGLGTRYAAWRIRAWGHATGGTTTNLQILIQQGTSTSAGSNTTVYTETARAYNTASAPWYIEGNFVWDSGSQVINCTVLDVGGATAGSSQAVGTATTSQNLATTQASYVIAAIFSATNANNTVSLDHFELEQLGVPLSV